MVDPKSNNETRVFINKHQVTPNETLNDIANQVESIESKRLGFVAVSRENITIDGLSAIKITHKDSINERTNKIESQRTEFAVVFMKGGTWYEIQYTAPPGELNKNIANFNMILDSFKVK